MKALTLQQQRVLAFVDGFLGHTGYPPTLKEIGEAIGLSNVNAVRGHLTALEKKGYVSRVPDKARSIRILHKPSAFSTLKRKIHEALRTDEGVVHQVVYGLAWVTHGRRQHFTGMHRVWMGEALDGEAAEHGWALLDRRIEPDHVALVVKTWPNHSPELAVGRFKAAGEAMMGQHGGGCADGPLWGRGYAATTDVELLDELLGELLQGEAEA